MRKLLISLGSNKGGEFLAFKESKIYSDDFIIYAFEPEPRCFSYIEETQKKVPNITHIKKAVSTYDGTASFSVGNLTVSGTLRDDKTWGLTGKKVDVETIDFVRWFNENINEDDYVILTVDIEGAEYDVMEAMIQDGCVSRVNKMYLEFHGEKLKKSEKDREQQIRETFTKMFGDNYFERFVEGNYHMFRKAYPDLDPNMFNNIGTINV